MVRQPPYTGFFIGLTLMLLASASLAQDDAAPPEAATSEATNGEINGETGETDSEASGEADDPVTQTLLARFSDDPDQFTHTDGEALYRTICQACHMEDGRGDAGAGAHPPLTDNPKMNSRHFLAGVILNGYHGMPGFHEMLSDEQVAELTNYVRSNFGNTYPDAMIPDEVTQLRPPEQPD